MTTFLTLIIYEIKTTVKNAINKGDLLWEQEQSQ